MSDGRSISEGEEKRKIVKSKQEIKREMAKFEKR